uniref:Uncharacterized protein n=1 Tax=Oryza punctata TaxID=4537 RepID=A0A0E0LYT7_ORYPU
MANSDSSVTDTVSASGVSASTVSTSRVSASTVSTSRVSSGPEHEKARRERNKSPPRSDYECSLDKSYKESNRTKKQGKDVAQLGMQSKQTIEPLVVQQSQAEYDHDALIQMMKDTGLTRETLMGLKSPPKATVDVDKWKTSYVYGRSLVNPKACLVVSAAAKEYQFMWIRRLRAPLALFIKNREIYRPSKKDKVIRDDQIKAIQESLAGFINDQVINPEGA